VDDRNRSSVSYFGFKIYQAVSLQLPTPSRRPNVSPFVLNQLPPNGAGPTMMRRIGAGLSKSNDHIFVSPKYTDSKSYSETNFVTFGNNRV
jgi:hypothetical protein